MLNVVCFSGCLTICSSDCLFTGLLSAPPSSLPFDMPAPRHGQVRLNLNHESNHNRMLSFESKFEQNQSFKSLWVVGLVDSKIWRDWADINAIKLSGRYPNLHQSHLILLRANDLPEEIRLRSEYHQTAEDAAVLKVTNIQSKGWKNPKCRFEHN